MRRRSFLAAAAAAAGSKLWAQEPRPDQQDSSQPYKVIDTHLHIFNTANDLPAHFGGVQREWATLDKTVTALRRGGVSKAFLISYTSMDIRRAMPARVDPVESLPVYSKAYMLEAWAQYPDLFCWFSDHVDPSREDNLEQVQEDLERGADGIKILSAFHGYLPDHPGLFEVYELCRRYNKPVIVDGSYWYLNRGPHMIPYKETPERLRQCRTIEGFVKTLANLLEAFPTVAFSLAHTGTAAVMSDYEAIHQVIVDHPNAYCDIAMSRGYSAEWLQQLVKAVGSRKVMFGTDWPYWSEGADSYRKGSKRWTTITEECPQFSEEDKRLILAGNAERFLRNELAEPEAEKTAAPARAMAQKAWQLQRKHPVIVIHDHNPVGPDASRMLAGGVTAKVYQFSLDVEPCAGFRESASQREGWAHKALVALEYAREAIENAPERLMFATTAADFEKAHREGKVAIMLGSEGGKLLEGKIEWLPLFHRHRLRELQLTWAVPNQIVERSGSAGDGLTAFGRDVVRECDKLGIILCLTHISRRAFDEVIDLSEKPQILSHEALGVGVNEERVRKLGKKGGVLGIHFYSTYLGPDPKPEHVVDQVDRIAQVAGIETAGLGCDFFPSEGPWGDFQRQQDTKTIVWALPGISYMSRVTEALLARNYPEDDIRKVLGGNFLRVCRAVFGA